MADADDATAADDRVFDTPGQNVQDGSHSQDEVKQSDDLLSPPIDEVLPIEQAEVDPDFKALISTVIPVTIEGNLFRVPIGSGSTRNARWLASTGLQRFSDRMASSRLQLVPVAMRILASGEIIAPTMPLAELVEKLKGIASSDNSTGVVVELDSSEGSEAGLWKGRHLKAHPSLCSQLPGFTEEADPSSRSLWQACAFSASPSSRARAEQLSVAARGEVLRAEAEAAAAADAQYTQLVAAHLKSVADGLSGSNAADDGAAALTLLASLDAEWSFIRVGALAPSPDQQVRLKALLAVHWEDLSTLFSHYASPDSGVGDTGLSLQMAEWLHLCCVSGVCPTAFPIDSARKVFIAANEDRTSLKAAGGDDGRTDSMNHFEFLEASILLGDALFGREVDTASGRLGPSGGFGLLLQQHFVPLAVWLRSGTLQRQMRDSSMQLWLRTRAGALRTVYAFYSAADGREADAVRQLMAGQNGKRTGTGNGPMLGASALQFKTRAPGSSLTSGEAAASPTRHTLSIREFAVMLEHAGLAPAGTGPAVALYAAGLAKGTSPCRVTPDYEKPPVPIVTNDKNKNKPKDSAKGAGLDVPQPGTVVVSPGPIDSPTIYEAFALAQLPGGATSFSALFDPSILGQESADATRADWMDELTYGEMVMAVARIGLYRWAHPAGIAGRDYRPDLSGGEWEIALKLAAVQRSVVRKAIMGALEAQAKQEQVRENQAMAALGGQGAKLGLSPSNASAMPVIQSAEERLAAAKFRGLIGSIAVQPIIRPGGSTARLGGIAAIEKEEEERAAAGKAAAAAAAPVPPKNTRRGSVSEHGIFSVQPGVGARRGSVVGANEAAAAAAVAKRAEAKGKPSPPAGKKSKDPKKDKEMGPVIASPPPVALECAAACIQWALEAVSAVAWHLGQRTQKAPLPMDAHDAQDFAANVAIRTATLSTSLGQTLMGALGSADMQAAGSGPGASTVLGTLSTVLTHSLTEQGRVGGGSTQSPARIAGHAAAPPTLVYSSSAAAALAISRAIAITADPKDGVMQRKGTVKSPFKFKVELPRVIRVDVPGPKPKNAEPVMGRREE